MNPLVIQCAWCRLVEVEKDYVPASPVPWAEVSHGICPDCYRIQIDDLLELGFEPEVRSPDLIVTHDPAYAAELIKQAAA